MEELKKHCPVPVVYKTYIMARIVDFRIRKGHVEFCLTENAQCSWYDPQSQSYATSIIDKFAHLTKLDHSEIKTFAYMLFGELVDLCTFLSDRITTDMLNGLTSIALAPPEPTNIKGKSRALKKSTPPPSDDLQTALDLFTHAIKRQHAKFVKESPMRMKAMKEKIEKIEAKKTQIVDHVKEMTCALFPLTQNPAPTTPTWTNVNPFEFFTISSHVGKTCRISKLTVKSIDKYMCNPIEEKYKVACAHEFRVCKKPNTNCNGFPCGSNQYMLWRAYSPTEEQMHGFFWTRSSLPLDKCKRSEILLSSEITEGNKEWQLSPDKNTMILCRCYVTNFDYFRTNLFGCKHDHLAMPAYRVVFERA